MAAMENHSNPPTSQERIETLIDMQSARAPEDRQDSQKKILIGIIVAVVILLALIIAGIIFLIQPTTDTARIRDIFIIIMALESLLIGLTLVILIVQLARLINLLQNEIKPILDSTNETVSTLRGTTNFISDNLVEPVIRLNEITAALSQVGSFIGFTRRKPKKKTNEF